MPRCPISASPFRPTLPSTTGALPSQHRRPALRRLAGVLALLALLTALPAPALAAPAGDAQAGPHLVVLDWFQGLLARLGFAQVAPSPGQETPASHHQSLGGRMDPDGVSSQGSTDDSGISEPLFLGGRMDPDG